MNALASRIRSTLSSALLLVASCGGRTIENSDANRAGTSGHAGGEWANTSGGTSGAISAGGSTGAMTSSSSGGGGAPQSVPSAVCQVELVVVPSVLEFLIDSSQSMKAELAPGITRWNAIRAAVGENLLELEERSLAGLLFYPSVQLSAGAHAGDSWCFLRYEAAPIGPLDGLQQKRMLDALAAKEPLGATPTHDAYRYALSRLEIAPRGPRRLVLLTDGAPTYGLGCTGTGDMPVDIEPLVAEVAAASDRNIDTFVLGLGTTENGPWMSRLARAGGTARPGCSDGGAPYCHYQVSDSADPNAALGEALTEIRTRSVSCEYQLPSPAYGSLLASDKASLVFQPGTGDAVRLSGLPPEANCPRPFALDAERRALELCETFCRRAANSVGSRVLLEFPCSSLP
ncbi:MAG TPA: vWA domain-containing protein [Polyangiaceae bacterium]|nr:vWA domain-containing protein [Polyangiaceae bacterium]